MSETYSVVLSGTIADGQDLEQVKSNVSRLFKLNGERLEALFSGKPVVVRKDVDLQQAEKIRSALVKAGAIAELKSNQPQAGNSRPVGDAAIAKVEAVKSSAQTFAPDLDCPRCGHHQPFAKACGLCKMDFTLHIKRLQRREQARAMRRQASA